MSRFRLLALLSLVVALPQLVSCGYCVQLKVEGPSRDWRADAVAVDAILVDEGRGAGLPGRLDTPEKIQEWFLGGDAGLSELRRQLVQEGRVKRVKIPRPGNYAADARTIRIKPKVELGKNKSLILVCSLPGVGVNQLKDEATVTDSGPYTFVLSASGIKFKEPREPKD